MHLKLLYNPAAGRGRARRHIEQAIARLRAGGAVVDAQASTSPDDMTRIAAESSKAGYDRVVVCGGDGTLHLAVREFDLQRGTLALLPLGSGDDFARVLGIPRELEKACDVVLHGTVREVDVATANQRRYVGVAGLGFDSEVARYANEHVKFLRGSLVYFYATLRVLSRFQPHRVRFDGRDEEIMFAAVGNTRQYGGGVRIVPDAQIDDGLLDLCLVHRCSRWKLVTTLPKAYSGGHVKSPFVEVGRAASFSFESEKPLDVYADGERLTQTPVRFGLAEGKLRVVT